MFRQDYSTRRHPLTFNTLKGTGDFQNTLLGESQPGGPLSKYHWHVVSAFSQPSSLSLSLSVYVYIYMFQTPLIYN